MNICIKALTVIPTLNRNKETIRSGRQHALGTGPYKRMYASKTTRCACQILQNQDTQRYTLITKEEKDLFSSPKS